MKSKMCHVFSLICLYWNVVLYEMTNLDGGEDLLFLPIGSLDPIVVTSVWSVECRI